jgi:hypothetical protein
MLVSIEGAELETPLRYYTVMSEDDSVDRITRPR